MTKMHSDHTLTVPTTEEITAGVLAARSKASADAAPETLKAIFSFLDLTTLNSTDWTGNVLSMTEKVNRFSESFPGMKNVGGICVFPNFVPDVRKKLTDKNVKIAAVSASFPSSQTFRDIKVAESRSVARAGADELDIVISVGAFLSGDYSFVADDIREIKHVIGKAHLKVILETGLLGDAANIFRASLLAMDAGADFIKTSTGKSEISATPEAAYVMCRAIKEFHSVTGRKVGFKPAGGVAATADALIYFHIVKDVLGDDWLNPGLFRIGASRLANNILTSLFPERTPFF